MGIKWVFYPSVDEDGYYIGEKQIGVGEGLFLADDVVETPLPEGIDLTKNYVRWDGSAWVVEAKPTTPAECVALGPVSHQSTTVRCNELRKLYEELTKGSEEYRLERGENLEWIVLKIPEPTPEEIEAYELAEAKAERAEAVSKIIVNVDGMKFDGDQTAQTRMGRTISAAIALGVDLNTEKRTWVLADNTVAEPTIAQLAKALRLAGDEQTKLWTIPYKEQEATQNLGLLKVGI